MSLVDFHCHLDLYPNFVELLEQCEHEQIYTLAVTTTPRAWPRNLELTKDKRFVKAALGLHPQLVNASWVEELKIWETYLQQSKYVGEVGIDAGKNFSHTLSLQQQVFSRILELCAKEGDKVLSVHSVNSAGIVLDLIERTLQLDKGKIVLHWFTGTNSEAKRALKLGCYFSINPKMLQTKKGQTLIEALPINKILTETDGPFIEMDGRKILPHDLLISVIALAKMKKVSTDHLSSQIVDNFREVIR